MPISSSSRKTRPAKLPVTLHPTGQYCKKITGKLYYFSTDKQEALTRYLEQASRIGGITPADITVIQIHLKKCSS